MSAGRWIAVFGLVGAAAVAIVLLRKPAAPTAVVAVVPRTPWGEPDLQGIYTSDAATLKMPERMPPLTPEGERHRSASAVTRGRYDEAAEFLPLFQRCLTLGAVGSLLPDIYGSGGNGIRILQGPGYLVIENEMVHEARVVPTSGDAPRLGRPLHLYMGDPRGRWDGNRLVIDSTNFTDGIDIRGVEVSASLHLVETLTPTAPDTIHYEFTVDDPVMYTAKWTGAIDFKANPGYHIYEYACHEGNYPLTKTLTAARARERSSSR